MADSNGSEKLEDWSADEQERVGAANTPPPPTVQPFDGNPAFIRDPAFFRSVIYFGGWTLVLAVGIMGLLAANDKNIPEGVVAVASGLVGLLTGTFAVKVSSSSATT